jgi:hypothetical protein
VPVDVVGNRIREALPHAEGPQLVSPPLVHEGVLVRVEEDAAVGVRVDAHLWLPSCSVGFAPDRMAQAVLLWGVTHAIKPLSRRSEPNRSRRACLERQPLPRTKLIPRGAEEWSKPPRTRVLGPGVRLGITRGSCRRRSEAGDAILRP